ncbi:DUF1456 family protein [Thalassotalea ganghwensis]
MTNNDVLRRVRYAFDLKDNKVVKIFSLVGVNVDTKTVQSWLKKDDDIEFMPLDDTQLANFLNGFIIDKRGAKDDQVPVAESVLTKNQILMKLKIALKLQTEDIQKLLAKVGIIVGQSELTAFFRNPEHKNYRHCKAQFLRNFIQALQEHYRPASAEKSSHKKSPNANKSNTKPAEKKIYVNPKATTKPSQSNRTVLKLKPKIKPEDIYKQ